MTFEPDCNYNLISFCLYIILSVVCILQRFDQNMQYFANNVDVYTVQPVILYRLMSPVQ